MALRTIRMHVRFMKTELGIIRALFLLGGTLFPLFWFVLDQKYAPFTREAMWLAPDPMVARFVVATYGYGMFIASFVHEFFRKRVSLFLEGYFYLATVYLFGLLYMSNFESVYVISLFSVLLCSIVGFKRPHRLASYLALFFLSSVVFAFVFNGSVLKEISFILMAGGAGLLAYFIHLRTSALRSEIAKSEDLIASLFASSKELILLVDVQTSKVFDCNSNFQKGLPLAKKEDIIDKSIPELLKGIIERKKLFEIIGLLESGRSFTGEVQIADGSWISLNASSIVLDSQKTWLFKILDITGKKQIAESLQLSYDILNRVDSLVIATNVDSDVVYISPSVERILGYAPREMLGQGWWEMRKQNERMEGELEQDYVSMVNQRLHPVKEEPYERRLFHRNGQEKWILWQDTATAGGFLIGIGYDVTTKKREETVKDVIYKISSLSHLSLPATEFYQAIHQEVRRVVNIDNLYIAQLNKASQSVDFLYFLDEKRKDLAPLGFSRKMVDGLTEYAIGKGETLLLSSQDLDDLRDTGEVVIVGSIPKVWLGIPLIVQNKVFGLFAMQDYHNPDTFDEETIALLTFISSQLALVISKHEADNALAQREEQLSGLFRQVGVGIAMLSLDGRFMEVNERLCLMLNEQNDTVLGKELNDYLSESSGRFDFKMLEDQLQNGGLNNTSEKKYYLKENQSVVLKILLDLVTDASGNPDHFVLVIEDITKSERASNFTALTKELSLSIWASNDLAEAMKIVIGSIAKHIGWAYAETWVYSGEKKALIRGANSYEVDEDLKPFFNASVNDEFAPGEGLPGAVFQEKKPIWISNIQKEPKFFRKELSSHFGLNTAVGIPVMAGEDVLSVLIFFNYGVTEQDDDIIPLIQALTPELSTFILRKQQDETSILKKSEAQFRALVQNSAEIIAIYNVSGQMTYISPSVKMILGYDPDERLHHSPEDLVHEEDSGRVKDAFNAVLQFPEIVRTVEYRARSKAGRTLILQTVFSNQIENEHILGVLASSRDITMRKAAEQELRNSEETYRAIFNTTTDLLFVHDKEGTLLDINQVVRDILGVEKHDIIGRNINDIAAIELSEPQKLKDALERVWNFEVVSFEFWSKKEDGTVFPIEMILKRGVYFGSEAIITTGRDIGARKEYEQRLKDTADRYRFLAENTGDLISRFNADGVFTYVSPASWRITGYHSREMVGKEIDDFFELDGTEFDREEHYDDEIRLLEHRIRKRDGSFIWVETQYKYILDDENSVEEVICASRDITARKIQEAELVESEERFRTLVEHATEAILVYDMNAGVILEAKYECREPFSVHKEGATSVVS